MDGPPIEPTVSEWETHLERSINHRTARRVCRLRIERVDGRLIVHGITRSYYVRQLAIAAILESAETWLGEESDLVEVSIEVSGV